MPVTGLAADQLKLIMGKLDYALQSMWDKGVWVWPLVTIHDAVMSESEDKYAEDTLGVTTEIMNNVMRDEQTGEHRFRVPIESDGEIMDRWQK
jgi:DNA polymerase I-like protein with 3'-5' exonuclease and polymerase domains